MGGSCIVDTLVQLLLSLGYFCFKYRRKLASDVDIEIKWQVRSNVDDNFCLQIVANVDLDSLLLLLLLLVVVVVGKHFVIFTLIITFVRFM